MRYEKWRNKNDARDAIATVIAIILGNDQLFVCPRFARCNIARLKRKNSEISSSSLNAESIFLKREGYVERRNITA
jgi:hypothetical protein